MLVRKAVAGDEPAPRTIRGARSRRGAVGLGVTLGLAVLWFALVAPTEPGQLTPLAFARIPVEGVAIAALALTVSGRVARRLLAGAVGVSLGLLAVLKVVELGFVAVLDRPFNPVADAAQLGPAVDFVKESFGPLAATGAVVGAVLMVLFALVGLPILVARLIRAVQGRRRPAAVAVLLLGAVWAVAALSGLRVGPHEPVASAEATRLVVREAGDVSTALRDRRAFAAATRVDAYREPRVGDLTGLEGKDVVVAFVESYGRVAVEGAASAGVRSMLDTASGQLQASGYAARSAYLTSSTFGGISWLAHATLQSGVWVDTQSSYESLLSGHRTSLTSVFGRAGWRTVALLPSNRQAWPEGRDHYGFDTVYDGADLGYVGPGFGFSQMPDQYALEAFHRLELGNGHPPVMAEVDLASSHGPWAPQPTMVAWDGLGDGSAFGPIHDHAESAASLLSDHSRVPAAYMTSIEYSLTALFSFVERYGDDNLVLVLLGDHQPATIVSGFGGNRDVPVTVVAHDPQVLARIAPWGWDQGLRPGPGAPVWRMDAFRDRFLDAFSDRSAPQAPSLVAHAQQAP